MGAGCSILVDRVDVECAGPGCTDSSMAALVSQVFLSISIPCVSGLSKRRARRVSDSR